MNLISQPTADQSSWSLPAWTYHDADFMALEKAHVFMPAWHLVCHVADIPKPGDYQTFAMMGERALVVRGRDGQVRAFHNSCRHRGSRICSKTSGQAVKLVCPYHQWTYDLKGRLQGVPFRRGVAGKGGARF